MTDDTWTPHDVPGLVVWYDPNADPSDWIGVAPHDTLRELHELLLYSPRPALPWWRRLSIVHPIRRWKAGREVLPLTDDEREQVAAYLRNKWGSDG